MASINESIYTLTGLKRVYINYVMDLLLFKSDNYELIDYAKQFIILLHIFSFKTPILYENS
jgi:hypothetical protein